MSEKTNKVRFSNSNFCEKYKVWEDERLSFSSYLQLNANYWGVEVC